MLYVLCGIPASGKTTLSENMASTLSAKIHRYDDMPNANRRGQHGKVYRDFCEGIKNDLLKGETVIADGTHITKRSREILLSYVKDVECKKVVLVMNTPLDVCIERNRARKNRRSDLCIVVNHKIYEEPSLEEGWDEIKVVENGEIDFT